MPTLAHMVAVGESHHVTQRGNNQQDFTLVDDDRRTYLQFLRWPAREKGTGGEEAKAIAIGALEISGVWSGDFPAPDPCNAVAQTT